MIWTAGVKVGYSTHCPSCYLDCGKHARTDAHGGFTIPDLDPDLLFRIVAVAEGHAPTFITRVDPAAGPITVTLRPRPLPGADARSVLRGRVVDPDGKPVPHAVVLPGMIYFTDGSARQGDVAGLDPLAVANDRGEFALCYQQDFAAIDLEVEARGFAKVRVKRLAPGPAVHTITVREGGVITGRVMQDGRPVPNVLVGVAQANRMADHFFGEQTVGADEHGRFRFENVPIAPTGGFDGSPYRLWHVYAKMESIGRLGAASPVAAVLVERDGKRYNVGDITLRPGLTFAGRVVLSDGAAIPDGMRITASRTSAWDSVTVPLAPDGSFRFDHLAPDDYFIFPSVKGYFLSRRNPSLSCAIEGRLDADTSDFIILMEPGEETFEGLVSGMRRGQPLRSFAPADLPAPAPDR